MNRLKVSNLNVYNSFRYLPFDIRTALCTIIDNSIAFSKERDKLGDDSVIVIYWNDDEKWLQIMDNSPGYDINELEPLWLTYEQPNINSLKQKQAAFYLGNKITIESKNEQFGFKSSLDLNNFSSNEVDVKFINPNDLIRSFKSGIRITIDMLNHSLSKNDLATIYEQLSFIYKDVIQKYRLSIIFAYIKDDTTYDLSKPEMIPVKSIGSINKLNFKMPEYNNTKVINIEKTIEVENKTISIKGKAYQLLVSNEYGGIFYSNKNRVITSTNSIEKPKWFDSSYKSIFVDLFIDGLETNLITNNFVWDNKIKEAIDSYVEEKISSLKTVLPKNLTQPLINSNDSKYKTKEFDYEDVENLNATKAFLTKVFNETNSMGFVDDFEIIKDKLHFTYNSDDGKKITMNLIKSKQREMKDEWIQLSPINQDDVEQVYEYDLKLNLNHPFFVQLFQDSKTSMSIEYFVICFAIAEIITKLDGLPVTQLKYEINKLLRGNNDR